MAEQIVWTSADGGTVIDLTDATAGYSVQANGTRGLRSVGYELTTTRYASIDGETVNAIHALPGTPTIGLLVESSGVEGSLRAKIRALVHAMRPKAGPGTLTVANELGEKRSLTCYCTGGMEGDEAIDVTLPGHWWKVALKFYAEDPWWYGDAASINLGLGAGANFFPIFPLVLAPSTVQGTFTVDLSAADAVSYPLWTVTGPGSALSLTNQTTGQVITVNAALAAGQSMIIDTRPGFQSVRLDDGTNLMGAVATDPALWPLVEDVNTVTAQLTGATSDSRITGVYAPRFSGI
jgi:hypothetical protein